MGLLQEFKERSNRTAKTAGLAGGIHSNVKFVDFSAEVESRGDFKRYLFMKFKQFDKQGNPLGEFATSFNALDASSDYIDFKTKLLLKQTHNLAVAIYGDNWVNVYDPLKGLVEAEDAYYLKLHAKLNKRAFVADLEKRVIEGVSSFVNGFLQEESAKKFILKIVYNDKGYIGLPADAFIQDQAEGKLKLALSDKEKSLIRKYKTV